MTLLILSSCVHLCIAVLFISVFDAVGVLSSTEAQCESIRVFWGRLGSQRVSCCTACCSSPPCCNGRYLLLTCSLHTITELCGGNLCLHCASLLPLSLLPCAICHTVTVALLSCTHTHTHTHTLLSSSSGFQIFSVRENEFRRSVVSLHGCVYQYLYIDLASPLLLHSSRYRLVFPAGICAQNLTDGRSARGEGVLNWAVPHATRHCVRPLSKILAGGRRGGLRRNLIWVQQIRGGKVTVLLVYKSMQRQTLIVGL